MAKKIMNPIAVVIIALVFILGSGKTTQAEKSETLEVLSETYAIDRIYRSMTGPQSTQEIRLVEDGQQELLWITGFRAEMVAPDGTTRVSQEFMCHSNLDINMDKHKKRMGWQNINPSTRLFTLSQGQYEVRFPNGFGIPVYSDEAFSLTTQVLNLNHEDGQIQLRHKISLEFIRDADLKETMKPLFSTAAYGLTLLEGEDAYFNVAKPDPETHGPGCLIGQNASDHIYRDHFRRKFTGHWVVKPGREVNRTLVTKLLRLPFDTTVHYIAVHLHPFAESLELRDLTTGKTVFQSEAHWFEDRIGLDRVTYFSTEDGIELYKDHEYELVSTYNNTSDEDQDSMAVMFLYVLDKEFKKQ